MSTRSGSSAGSAELRRRAEDRLGHRITSQDRLETEGDLQRALHELRVHEVELEMQNEELLDTRARLEALLERYTALYDFAPDGYLTLRDDGSIREANLAVAALFGVERAALPGADLLSFIAPDDQPAFVATIASARQSGLRHSREFTLREGAAARFVRLSALRSGAATELLVALEDITARRHAEESRHRIEQKMLQAQKLESLGVLAGGIAHDFNNLLMSILGNANLATELVPPAGKAHEFLAGIELASRRAAALCRQLLAYAGRGQFSITTVDLSALVREMPQLLAVSISKRAELVCDLPEHLPAVEGDPDQLRQVAMNLIINASESLGDRNGRLRITTGTMDCDTAHLATCCTHLAPATPGTFVFLEVEDTGCGMDAETQARMFDPFFSTKFTGRGLGLAALLGIVRYHKGALKVHSEPGRGTSVRVLLPAANAKEPATPVPAIPAARSHAPATILIVDDEKIVRDILANALTKWGFGLRLATDGRAAIELLRGDPTTIGATILDLHMPQLDGEETFHQLRQIRPDLPVILSSGFCETATKARLLAAGVAAILEKPFDIDELHTTLCAVLDESAASAPDTGAAAPRQKVTAD